jgi:RHS repeat-associated protein
MYDEQGNLTWEADLDIYGKVRNFAGRSLSECPFRWQGQYEDSETGLYYNRFRYYSPEEGIYISQDPIRLEGGMVLYSYVKDPNSWVDVFGLDELYALIATKDGWYPVFDYGKKAPIGEVFLKEGDLWKIGTSVDASKRYSKTYLNSIGQGGVEMKILHTNISRKTTLFLENLKLRGYLFWKGHLPAGNKCCH